LKDILNSIAFIGQVTDSLTQVNLQC